MKKNILIVFTLLSLGKYHAQNVGVNTNAPETELHINGTMSTDGIIIKDPLEKLGVTEDYSFLIKSPAPYNKITSYNQTFLPQSPAPLNLVQFKITCDPNDKDWINQYDTKINSDKFLVIISSFGFTQPIFGDGKYTPLPQIYAYYNNGTWKLKADYESFKPLNSYPTGEWTLNLIVFDRAYAREFTSTQSVSNNTTASAENPLIQ